MDRLIDGKPIRSDGKLTVKSLAEEAGVKRWLLTHKHTDLQDEFRARVEAHGQVPAAQQALAEENDRIRTRMDELGAQLAETQTKVQQPAWIVHLLTLQNEELRTSGAAAGAVRPLRQRG